MFSDVTWINACRKTDSCASCVPIGVVLANMSTLRGLR